MGAVKSARTSTSTTVIGTTALLGFGVGSVAKQASAQGTGNALKVLAKDLSPISAKSGVYEVSTTNIVGRGFNFKDGSKSYLLFSGRNQAGTTLSQTSKSLSNAEGITFGAGKRRLTRPFLEITNTNDVRFGSTTTREKFLFSGRPTQTGKPTKGFMDVVNDLGTSKGSRYNEITKRLSTVRKYDNGEVVVNLISNRRITSRGGSVSNQLGNDFTAFTSGRNRRSGGTGVWELRLPERSKMSSKNKGKGDIIDFGGGDFPLKSANKVVERTTFKDKFYYRSDLSLKDNASNLFRNIKLQFTSRSGRKYIIADYNKKLPIKANSAEEVYSAFSIDTFGGRKAYYQAFRVLRPDGKIRVVTGSSRKGVLNKLKDAGFENVKVRKFREYYTEKEYSYNFEYTAQKPSRTNTYTPRIRFNDDVRGVIKDINLKGTSKSTGSSLSSSGPTITETKSISPSILAPRQSKVLNNPKSSLKNGILGVVGVSTGRSSGDALRTGTSNCIGGVVSGFKKGFSKRQGSALTGNSILEEPRASNKNINTNLNSPRTTGTILSGLSTGLSTALSGGLASGLGSPSRSRGSQVTRTNQKTAVVPIVTPISPPISSTRNRITPRGFNTGRGSWNIPRPSPVKVFGGRLPFTLSDRGYGKGGIGVRAGKTRYKSDIASSFLGIKSPKIPVSYRKGLGGLTFRPLISSRKSKKREKKRKKR